MRSLLPCLLLILLAVPRTEKENDLDPLVEEARKAWQVPGCAVAVVKDDRVILLRGYGVREHGKRDAVTADTVFSTGSLTKAVTATALAKLVEQGKLGWDDPVRKHVPYFRLSDPAADRAVTLRDLLCHRTGLGRHDLLWHGAPWTIEETVRRVAHLELAQPFRSGYLYNNIAYLTLGLAITKAAGKPWEEYVRKELFEPLGMKGVVFTRSAALAAADHASPHRFDHAGKKLSVLEWYDDDKQVRASGSVKASARDLSRWLRFHLNEGSLDGKQIVARDSLRETYRPMVAIPVPGSLGREAETKEFTYALGWRNRDHRRHPLLEHGGTVNGFRAHLVLATKQKVGVVVLSNLGDSDFPVALCYTLLEQILGLEKRDWNGVLLDVQQRGRAAQKRRLEDFQASRQPGTIPSRELPEYAGEYVHPAYGKAVVTVADGKLALAWSRFKLTLKHFHLDTWTSDDTERLNGEPVAFRVAPDGAVPQLRFLGMDFKREER